MAPDPVTEMRVKKGGLELRNPFVVGSGPTCKTVEQFELAEAEGWGAISMKLTVDPEPYISRKPRYRWIEEEGYHVFTAEKRLNVEEGIALMKEARRRARKIAILANITHFGAEGFGGWGVLAKRFADEGADAIELNFCCPNMSFNLDALGLAGGNRPATGASLGQIPEAVAKVVEITKKAVKIPVWAKLTPEGGRIAEVAKAALAAGADALVSVGNYMAVPPFDIDHPEAGPYRLLDGTSIGCMSGPWVRPMALRDVYQIRRAVGTGPTICGYGGLCDHVSAVQFGMVGADLFGICTEVMLRGFRILKGIMRNLAGWMEKQGYAKTGDFRDKAIPAFRAANELVIHDGHAQVDPNACTGCKLCTFVGHCDAIEMRERKAVVTPSRCTGCSTCVDICPEHAIAMQAEG